MITSDWLRPPNSGTYIPANVQGNLTTWIRGYWQIAMFKSMWLNNSIPNNTATNQPVTSTKSLLPNVIFTILPSDTNPQLEWGAKPHTFYRRFFTQRSHGIVIEWAIF